jgi:hypothetical protein
MVTRVTVTDMRILMHQGLAGWARSRVMANFKTCGLMLDSNVSLIIWMEVESFAHKHNMMGVLALLQVCFFASQLSHKTLQ